MYFENKIVMRLLVSNLERSLKVLDTITTLVSDEPHKTPLATLGRWLNYRVSDTLSPDLLQYK